jgi:hypothetical protein
MKRRSGRQGAPSVDPQRDYWNRSGRNGKPPRGGRRSVRVRRIRVALACRTASLQSKDDFILRLEKDSVAKVLPAIESRTGVHVQTVVTDNK